MKRYSILKHLASIVTAWSLIMVTSNQATANAAITILSPRENSFVESPQINLVLRAEIKESDIVKLTLNNRKVATAAKYSGNFHLSYSPIPLAPGMNILRISILRGDRILEEKQMPIYFRSDLSPTSGVAPSGFSRFYFHLAANERQCSACHNLDFNKVTDNPDKPESSPCFTCHGKLLADFKIAHGPAAVWSCTSCHDPKSKLRKLATKKPDDKVCSDCHEYSWLKMKEIHGPTAAGSCTTCHDPHGSRETYFLRMATADLCAACHEEILFKPHVISGFSGKPGHPVRLSNDPRNPSREFNCVSCHNPHATDFPLMLKADHNNMYVFCQSCHRM